MTEDELFEKLCLEALQAGLSWLVVLRKRQHFRRAFGGFDPAAVAAMDSVDPLVRDPNLIRNRAKLEALVHNARVVLRLAEREGGLAALVWKYAEWDRDPPRSIPRTTRAAEGLAAELKGYGWRFIGPVSAYAFMQSAGLVNDHTAECDVREAAEANRRAAFARVGSSPWR